MTIRTLALLTLAVMAITATPVRAAIIAVDTDAGAGVVEIAVDGLCSIREAIDNANQDWPMHADCAAGDGADTIVLPNDAMFTLTDEAVDDSGLGSSGLPHIESTITLKGNGASIERDNSLNCILNFANDPDEFRLLLIDSGGNLTAEDLTLAQGCVDSGGADDRARQGGAIFNNQGVVTLRRTTVRDNQAFFDGGGIFNELGGSTLQIESSTFANNSASLGGALFLRDDATLRNTTLSGNSANSDGGGIYLQFREATLEQTTFFDNSSGFGGGGIYSQQGITNAKNIILQDSSCGEQFGDETWTAVGANLVSSSSCESLFGTSFTVKTNAELGLLADNGGPTQTHALQPGSPAIDAAGDCSSIDGTETIEYDQRAVARPQGSDCDIGAFELVQVPGIALSKIINSGDPYSQAGDEIVYELIAENTGNVALDNVTISDPDATISSCTPAAGSSLAPTDTMSCQAIYTVTQNDVDEGSFTNTASVEADGPEDSTVEAHDSATARFVLIFKDRFETGE